MLNSILTLWVNFPFAPFGAGGNPSALQIPYGARDLKLKLKRKLINDLTRIDNWVPGCQKSVLNKT